MNRSVLRVVAILTIIVLGPLTAASAATAEAPGHDDRLTFMRQDESGFWQVWVANADLTRERQVTFERANSGWPVWSPDGRHIAFDSDRSDPDPTDEHFVNDVFTMRPNGTDIVNLTGSVGVSGDPSWSPDGKSIAFQSDRGLYPNKQGIYVMRRDGTHISRVTRIPAGAFDTAPRFSPDGHRLVFTRYGGEEEFGDAALHTVGVSGKQVRQITPFAIGAGDADWSPNGERIVFEAYPDAASRGDVYVVRDNGRSLRNITDNPATTGSADPVWSPDGRTILFLQGIFEANEATLGLATMKADGSHRAFISPGSPESHQPDWYGPRPGLKG